LRLSELRNVFAEGSICSGTIEMSQGSLCGTHFEGAAEFFMLRPRGRKKSLSPARPTCQGCISAQAHTFHCRPQFDTRSILSAPLSESNIGGSHRLLQAAGPEKKNFQIRWLFPHQLSKPPGPQKKFPTLQGGRRPQGRKKITISKRAHTKTTFLKRGILSIAALHSTLGAFLSFR